MGHPLGPLGRQAKVVTEEEEGETLSSVLSGPAPQKEHKVAKLASPEEPPQLPGAQELPNTKVRVISAGQARPPLALPSLPPEDESLLEPCSLGPSLPWFPPPLYCQEMLQTPKYLHSWACSRQEACLDSRSAS